MRLLLITLMLLPSLTVNALSGSSGAGTNSLYGCFHNGVIYSTTLLHYTCSSLAPHTHVKDSHTFHYNATGMVPIAPFKSKSFAPSTISPVIHSNSVIGDPDCILSKIPIGQ